VETKHRRIATGSIAAAILIGGAVVAATVSSHPAPKDVAIASTVESPSPALSPSAAPSPTVSAAAAKPSPSAAKSTPAARRTSKAASRSTGRTEKVVSSGSCGASFYDEPQMTANGETFDPDALTAASKTLAFGTRVRVTSVDTGKAVTVRINDRGPYIDGRCLDLSRAAFDAIDDLDKGAVTVRYEILK
jgi:rare lipoprotein A